MGLTVKMTLHFLRNVIAVTVGALIALGVYDVIKDFVPFRIADETTQKIEISYVDFVSITLTSVTIMLAILGFFVALLAFFGWKSIGSIATSAGEGVVKAALKEDGVLHKEMIREVRSIYKYRGIEPVDEAEYEEEMGEKT